MGSKLCKLKTRDRINMRIETYIPGLSKNTIEIVKHAESLGYDALVSGELNNEPFLPVLLGLEHSKK